MSEDMTPRPSIDPESPRGNYRERDTEFKKLLPKYDSIAYRKMYYIMKKFRNRQRVLLDDEDIEDPDPFLPTYIFYCFQGDHAQ